VKVSHTHEYVRTEQRVAISPRRLAYTGGGDNNGFNWPQYHDNLPMSSVNRNRVFKSHTHASCIYC